MGPDSEQLLYGLRMPVPQRALPRRSDDPHHQLVLQSGGPIVQYRCTVHERVRKHDHHDDQHHYNDNHTDHHHCPSGLHRPDIRAVLLGV